MRKLCCILCALLMLCAAVGLGEGQSEFADFSEKFADKFLPEGSEAEYGEYSYRSDSICIEISAFRDYRSDIYVADIYIKSPENLRRIFGGNKWNTKMGKMREMAKDGGAILALTGDNAQNLSQGMVVGNGVVLRKTGNRKRDVCVLYRDGTMECVEMPVDNDVILERADDIWQLFLFGPSLLDSEGHAKEKYTTNVGPANPRAVIGYYEPGHYCLVQVDGRGSASKISSGAKSVGMKMVELGAFMESLGCTAAYNLDGGQSAMMYFNGQVISKPYNGGRTIGDIIAIVEIDE